MSPQEQIAADQAAVQAAQAVLDAANAKLAEDQAVLDALQPHLSVLDEIEAYAIAHINEDEQEIHRLIAKARALFGFTAAPAAETAPVAAE